jgi:hypothetical protein
MSSKIYACYIVPVDGPFIILGVRVKVAVQAPLKTNYNNASMCCMKPLMLFSGTYDS